MFKKVLFFSVGLTLSASMALAGTCDDRGSSSCSRTSQTASTATRIRSSTM